MKKTSFFIIACAVATSIFITGCSIFSKPASKMIIIQGEVNRPGEYIVKKPIKFILLLFKAYGYTENAAPKNAVVERNGKSSIINLSIPANEPPPHLAETFTVYPGDIITIPRIKTLKKIQTKQ